MKMLLGLLLCLWLITPQSLAKSFDENDPLLVEAQLQPLDLSPGQTGNLLLKVSLPKGYHAYEDQFKLTILEPEGFLIGPPRIEPMKTWYDKFSKRNRTGVEKSATLTFQIEAPTQVYATPGTLKFVLTYQACGETFCLFPTKKNLETPWSWQGEISAPSPMATSSSFKLLEEFKKALNGSRPLAFFIALLAGLLTSFTPCIFPMIPITIAILSRGSDKRTRAQNFALSVVYVQGIAFTYSILGVIAVKTGSLFGSSLGNPWVVGGLCLLMLAMALSLFGLYELQVPAFLRNRFSRGTHHTGYLGAFVSGLLAGIIASPCVGPILVSILAFVSTQASYVLGFFLLYVYALGMGMLFIVLGAFSELTRVLPRSGPWLEGVKLFLGLLMLAGFYYYLQFVFTDRWWNLALGAGLVIFSSFYGAFSNISTRHPFQKVRKGLMLTAFVVGVLFTASGALNWNLPGADIPMGSIANNVPAEEKLNWVNLTPNSLAQAAEQNRPVIIDFWAEWCAACHELERFTFANPEVRQLSNNFTLLKFDATQDSATLRELKKKYKILGLPTVLFFNSKGEWLESLTLTEFEKPQRFLQRMHQSKSL